MDVGIIGGGMMGLATAYYLNRQGVRATILEKHSEVGGLSRSMQMALGIRWDRYYHVILSTDTELLEFIDELGLSPEVAFMETKTGFYTDGQLFSMSNTWEFLKFRPLSLVDKLRLGAGIIFASRIHDHSQLESMLAKTWLIRVFGRRNYEKMWAPLLKSKLGTAHSIASGAFIWAIIKRYYGTRQKGAKKEVMGCAAGGYHSILESIRNKLQQNGVRILPGHDVQKLSRVTGNRWRLDSSQEKSMVFDKVITTLSNPGIIELLPRQNTEALRNQLKKIKYLNLVCITLLLKSGLCPYYVTNLTDPGFPFTGVIDATNIVPEKILKGRGLVYLPRWMPVEDSFCQKPDNEILESFISGLKRIFPGFSADDILSARVNRESNVQPIQTRHYRRDVPNMITGLDNLYMVNTTMILDSTLNNNQVIRLAREIAHTVLEPSNAG